MGEQPKRPQWQMSLGTALLILLWAASAIDIYVNRNPWRKEAKLYSEAEVKSQLPLHPDPMPAAPDGLRIASHIPRDRQPGEEIGAAIIDIHASTVLCHVGQTDYFPVCFTNNDTLLFAIFPDPFDEQVRYVYFHRQYPEWWWGNFYRPEVWTTVLLSLLLFGLALKRRGAPEN